MAANNSYDRQLRSIGQSLEAQRISVFELTRQGESYIVQGEPEKETSLLAALRSWQKRLRSDGVSTSLVYKEQDIAELDRQGLANRTKANRLPDFHSLPNTLRMVGAHLDAKQAALLRLQKSELGFTILSRNKNGLPEMEERDFGSFYEYFLKLHGSRESAAKR